VTGVTRPPILTEIDAAADDSPMRRNPEEEDPVARLQEEARWSSFTNSWSRQVSGGAPRWVRWFIIVVVVLILFVPGLIGLIGLITRHESSTQELPRDCPTLESGQTTFASCIQLFPTGP
jgi:hypothetical protein